MRREPVVIDLQSRRPFRRPLGERLLAGAILWAPAAGLLAIAAIVALVVTAGSPA